MTLNLNINFGANAVTQTNESSQVGQAQNGVDAKKNDFQSLSVTQKAVSAEDIAAAAINDDALTRDDPLGNLVKSAFNLPPPPPPWASL